MAFRPEEVSSIIQAQIQKTDMALEMLTDAIRSQTPLPERKVTIPESIPSLEELSARRPSKDGVGKLHHTAGS